MNKTHSHNFRVFGKILIYSLRCNKNVHLILYKFEFEAFKNPQGWFSARIIYLTFIFVE